MADFGDFGVLEYLCAASARALCQRLCDINRIGIAIARNVNAAHDIVDIDDTRHFFDFLGRYDMHRQVKHLGHRRAALQLLEPLLVCRHGNRAALTVSGGLTSLGLKPAI